MTLKTPKMRVLIVALVIISNAVFQARLYAAANETPVIACPQPSLAPRLKKTPGRSNAPIKVQSRTFAVVNEGLSEARGEVELRRADQLISTDLLLYDPAKKTATMPGKMYYEDSMLHLNSANANYSFLDEQGHFTMVDYGLVGSSARGSAAELTLDSGNHSLLRQMQFTTCAGESPEWLLTARKLELNFDTGVGEAWGAKLKFFNVPIFYLPYISFPIDDRRKSGFLYPYLSVASGNGVEFSIPYYWNIAANQDATITPRYFTQRGAMLTGEYRLLTRRTRNTLNFDYMPDDKITGDNRYHYLFVHSGTFNSQWRSRIRVDRISDTEYFQDFGDSLLATSRQYLKSAAGIYGSGHYWKLAVTVDDFQVVDKLISTFREPYSRVPRVVFDLDRPLGLKGMQLQLDAELVYFDRNVDIGATGARFDIFPRIEWDLKTSWGYLRPRAGYRYTRYELDWNGLPGDTSPDRGTEIISIDTGMFLQRERKNGLLQTLEPRLFYLYVPNKDQTAIPNFDSAPFTFGFSQLFHYNRFTGADRQSDANQLTLALTTRTINSASGNELWSLSLGQIIFFEDQRVTTELGPPLDDSASPFIGELIYHPGRRLSARIGAQWNWQQDQIDVAILGIAYSTAGGTRLGAEYRFRRNDLDQVDLRYYQPINARWRVSSRVVYSLEGSELLAAEAGFEYDSCCWALRFMGKRFLRNRAGDHRDSIFVQLILKGLTSIGSRAEPNFYDPAY